jgi:hypothetical protein
MYCITDYIKELFVLLVALKNGISLLYHFLDLFCLSCDLNIFRMLIKHSQELSLVFYASFLNNSKPENLFSLINPFKANSIRFMALLCLLFFSCNLFTLHEPSILLRIDVEYHPIDNHNLCKEPQSITPHIGS